MKKVLFLASVLTLLLQVPAFAETKIGFISVQAILSKCDYGKASSARLKAKFEPMKKEIERETAEIKKLESELKNQDLALKLEAKQDKQREYRRKVRDQQDSVAAFRQRLQVETQKEQQPIVKKIVKVANDYGMANGYSAIVEMGGVSIFVDEKVDLTDVLIEEMNKLKKAGK